MADGDCEILLFPIRKRVGRIRHAASKFVDGRSKAQQKVYWKMISSSLAESMTSQGFDREEIEQAIYEMRDSVQDEINRMVESQGKSTESK